MINTIITYSPYSPYSLYRLYYVTRTPTNGSAVSLLRVSVRITLPVYCTAIGGCSGYVIRTYK